MLDPVPHQGATATLQNRDSYQRQTGPLQVQTGTRPLAPRPTMDAEALRASAEATLGKARKSIANLEPRIELLLRSCEAANLPVPGVAIGQYKHPISPKGEQIVTYLVTVYHGNPPLAKTVQVVAFRFQDAVNVVDRTQVAMEGQVLTEPLVEELRLKCFYLARFHEEFKGDKVLSQLFPPPQTVQGKPTGATGQQQAPLSTVERLKLKQAREAVLHKAEILAANLAPKMEIMRLTLEMLDKPQGLNIGALFTPETRQARFIAMGIGADKALVGQLREAFQLYNQLQEQLKEARKGGEVEELKETIFPLSRLAITCRKHAVLKDLFPVSDESLVPEEE